MPLTAEAYENFYLGTCAELHVASLFYFAGYEASKVAPDSGVDYLVTNVARRKFKGEKQKIVEVQVKSTVLDQTGASFYMTGDELEFLSQE